MWLIVGCDSPALDADGDGLSYTEEAALGLDPERADTDGDGLNDGEEVDLRTDPLLVDTDDDGYTDRDEVFEGHDPLSKRDRIYTGHWPYWFAKDEISLGLDVPAAGERFPRWVLPDQHGEKVELFDFFQAGPPIVLAFLREWSGPDNALAEWITGGDDAYRFGDHWPAGPDVVARGDVRWISVLVEDLYGQPGSSWAAERWADLYESKDIPVLADSEEEAAEYLNGLPFTPFVVLLTPDLTLDPVSAVLADAIAETVLRHLNEAYPE